MTGDLHRIRHGARATLILGIGASLAANMLAADPSIIGRIIAAWSPLALLLTVELLSRVPAAPGWLSRVRVASAASIAGIAAWVSYWHMVEVAAAYGEGAVAAHLLPFSVDGLVIVSSICLMEISQRMAADADDQTDVDEVELHDVEEPIEAPTPIRAPKPTPPAGGGLAVTVNDLADLHPDWTQAQIAAEAGCSERTVRRHLTNNEAA